MAGCACGCSEESRRQGQDLDSGKGRVAVTSGRKRKGPKRPCQENLAGWVVRTPKDGVGDSERYSERGQRDDELTTGSSEGEDAKIEQGSLGARTSLVEAWGAGDVGAVKPGYESGVTDKMLNAFNRDTRRALADWVGDREHWPG